MDKLLVVGCSESQQEKLNGILGNHYDLEYVDTTEEAAAVFSSKEEYCRMIILEFDAMKEQVLHFLEQTNTERLTQNIPLLILSDDLPDQAMDEALKRGAYEYLHLSGSPWLLLQRVKNIDLVLKKQNPGLQAMNTYLFNNCIGAAMLLESDLETIRPILINDQFFELVGHTREEFLQYSGDLFPTTIQSEIDDLRNALQQTKETGRGQCMMSNPLTRKRFRVEQRRIGGERIPFRFLVTVEDITDSYSYQEITDALLHLPGQVIFDYDAAADRSEVYIGTKDKKTQHETLEMCLEVERHQWISPQSYRSFLDAFHKARAQVCDGSVELLASLIHGNYTWHRLFYRSIADANGKVTRIVGRIDDLERMESTAIKREESGLCDAETHLLTYRAAVAFVDQIISKRKEGILVLVEMNGLRTLCADMSASVRQMYIRELIRQMKSLFISTDIVGRFGDEGLLIFMPETTSYHLAEKKAHALLELVMGLFPYGECTCNVGISIIHNGHLRAASVINDANIALWKSRTEGLNRFVIFTE